MSIIRIIKLQWGTSAAGQVGPVTGNAIRRLAPKDDDDLW